MGWATLHMAGLTVPRIKNNIKKAFKNIFDFMASKKILHSISSGKTAFFLFTAIQKAGKGERGASHSLRQSVFM